MKKIVNYNRVVRFIIFLIPLFLIFMGMKVPDLSRPHKPKPMRRAVLDKTPSRTIVESSVKAKVDIDSAIPMLPVIVALSVLEFPLEAQSGHLPAPQLSATPLPPRAPPA